jgi:hypothetical protein
MAVGPLPLNVLVVGTGKGSWVLSDLPIETPGAAILAGSAS